MLNMDCILRHIDEYCFILLRVKKVLGLCKKTILFPLEMHTDVVRNVAAAAAAKSLQLCLTLCDPIDGSPPSSPVPGILQARTLEWVAISFSNV